MRNYFRLMLGPGSVHAPQCFADSYVGADFQINQDLTAKLPDEWRGFNSEFIPIYLAAHPEKSKIAAGLACGSLWSVAKGIQQGDIVLCPDGAGRYRVGEVTGSYYWVSGGALPHRRPVKWLPPVIDRGDMSAALKASTGSIGTISKISRHRDEIETLIGGAVLAPAIISTDESVEDPAAFALEKHLEEFLVENDQTVHGAIIALEDDQRIRRALAIVPTIAFFRYQVSFKLVRS